MMIRCIRRIGFCSGHRLMNHEGKCIHMHGHNYTAEIYAEAQQLDDLGRVIDFSVLKEKIGGWIDTHWDHGFIRHTADLETAQALKLTKSKEFALPYNPTAENLARYLLETVCPAELATHQVHVTKVVMWETENCYAECSL